METTTSHRIEYIDALKGVTMFPVVYSHILFGVKIRKYEGID